MPRMGWVCWRNTQVQQAKADAAYAVSKRSVFPRPAGALRCTSRRLFIDGSCAAATRSWLEETAAEQRSRRQLRCYGLLRQASSSLNPHSYQCWRDSYTADLSTLGRPAATRRRGEAGHRQPAHPTYPINSSGVSRVGGAYWAAPLLELTRWDRYPFSG
jgi:hypothetical protein